MKTSSSNAYRLLHTIYFAGSRRRGKHPQATPSFAHALDVAFCLAYHDDDPDVLEAAILHNSLDDTDTTVFDIAAHFGHRTAATVLQLTDGTARSKAERQHSQIARASAMNGPAARVRMADKIVSVVEVATSPPVGWSLKRQQAYFYDAKQVVDRLPGIGDDLRQSFNAVFEHLRAK